MRGFRDAVERQIAKARAEGKLSGLAGEGHPLPDRTIETGQDASMSAAMRLMAEAGALPEEFSLQKQLDIARSAYGELTDPDEKRAAMKVIADLELKTNMSREARRKFFE